MMSMPRAITIAVLTGCLVLYSSVAPAKETHSYDWEDPEMIGRNKEAPHATLMQT